MIINQIIRPIIGPVAGSIFGASSYTPVFSMSNLGLVVKQPASITSKSNTRTSPSAVFDHEHVLVEVPAGGTVLQGGRLAHTSATGLVTESVAVIVGREYQISTRGDNASTVVLSNAATGILTNNGADRFALPTPIVAGTTTLTMTVTGTITQLMVEDVTGKSNKAPSGYLDPGTDYGYGVNGLSWFASSNGNEVSSAGVVTELPGYSLATIAERSRVDENLVAVNWAAGGGDTTDDGVFETLSDTSFRATVSGTGRAWYDALVLFEAGRTYCISARFALESGSYSGDLAKNLYCFVPATGDVGLDVAEDGINQAIFTATSSEYSFVRIGVGTINTETTDIAVVVSEFKCRDVTDQINQNAPSDDFYGSDALLTTNLNTVTGGVVNELPGVAITKYSRWNAGTIFGDSLTSEPPKIGSNLYGLVGSPCSQQGVPGSKLHEIVLVAEANIPLMPPERNYVLIEGGLNTINETADTLDTMLGYTARMVAAANQYNKAWLVINITPWAGAAQDASELARTLAYNAAVKSLYGNKVIDVYTLLGDPADPTKLDAQYDSGDNVHLTTLGYQTVDAVIALKLESLPIELLFLPATTNGVLNSTFSERTSDIDLDDWAATKTGTSTITHESIDVPAGFTSACNFTTDGAGSIAYLSQFSLLEVGVGEVATLSMMVKSARPEAMQFQVLASDSVTGLAQTLSADGLSWVDGLGSIYLPTDLPTEWGWWSLALPPTNAGRTHVTMMTVLTRSTSAETSIISGLQLEQGGLATPPVITTTAQSDRGADLIAMNGSLGWLDPDEFIALITITIPDDFATRGQDIFAMFGGTALVAYRDPNLDGVKVFGGTTVAQIIDGNTPGEEINIAVVGSVELDALTIGYPRNGAAFTWAAEATFSGLAAGDILSLGAVVPGQYSQRGLSFYNGMPPGTTDLAGVRLWAEAMAHSRT